MWKFEVDWHHASVTVAIFCDIIYREVRFLFISEVLEKHDLEVDKIKFSDA